MRRFLNFIGVGILIGSFFFPRYKVIAAPEVVVSIQPIYSLTASIMQGAGKPTLLIKGAHSPHTFALKPSQVKLLNSAELLIWVGPGLESALEKLIAKRSKNSNQLQLLSLPGLNLYPLRNEPNSLESHDPHEHAGPYDPHIWLDINNAKIIVNAIAGELKIKDPQNAEIYTLNQTALLKRLDCLHHRLTKRLAPLTHHAYIVFHDGYQYFEKAYGLNHAGTLTLDPELQISAKRLAYIHLLIKQKNIRCLFSEIQFHTRLIEQLGEKTKIKTGILDPYGAYSEYKPEDQYFKLMENLASQFSGCLK